MCPLRFLLPHLFLVRRTHRILLLLLLPVRGLHHRDRLDLRIWALVLLLLPLLLEVSVRPDRDRAHG